jgi:hypothetical protein
MKLVIKTIKLVIKTMMVKGNRFFIYFIINDYYDFFLFIIVIYYYFKLSLIITIVIVQYCYCYYSYSYSSYWKLLLLLC